MSPRVLVVDDDPMIRDSLVDVLEDHGYEVSTAGNGEQALARLRSEPAPAAILLDLMMPVLDGRGFLEAQAADPHLAQIPVIVLSAYRDMTELEWPAVRATIHKPMELHALLELLETCCAA